jgi:hypothetical protein
VWAGDGRRPVEPDEGTGTGDLLVDDHLQSKSTN